MSGVAQRVSIAPPAELFQDVFSVPQGHTLPIQLPRARHTDVMVAVYVTMSCDDAAAFPGRSAATSCQVASLESSKVRP